MTGFSENNIDKSYFYEFILTLDESILTNWIKVCCGLFLLGVEQFSQNTGTPLSGILDGSCQCIDRIPVPSKQSKIKNHLARRWGYVFSTVCWLWKHNCSQNPQIQIQNVHDLHNSITSRFLYIPKTACAP